MPKGCCSYEAIEMMMKCDWDCLQVALSRTPTILCVVWVVHGRQRSYWTNCAASNKASGGLSHHQTKQLLSHVVIVTFRPPEDTVAVLLSPNLWLKSQIFAFGKGGQQMRRESDEDGAQQTC